jgi:hypothetical protein
MDDAQRHQTKGITTKEILRSARAAVVRVGALAFSADPGLVAGTQGAMKAGISVRFAGPSLTERR